MRLIQGLQLLKLPGIITLKNRMDRQWHLVIMNPPTNPLQYTANTHPGLITVLSTINPPRFAEFKPEDWNREDIPAAPPGTIFDPFYESAHYKILALGSRYTSKKKPKFDLRINIRNNYNDSWLKWMYEKSFILFPMPTLSHSTRVIKVQVILLARRVGLSSQLEVSKKVMKYSFQLTVIILTGKLVREDMNNPRSIQT